MQYLNYTQMEAIVCITGTLSLKHFLQLMRTFMCTYILYMFWCVVS